MNFVGRFLCHVVFSFVWFLKSRPFACEPLDLLFRFPPPLLLVFFFFFFSLVSLFFLFSFLFFFPKTRFQLTRGLFRRRGCWLFPKFSRGFSFPFFSFLPCCYTYRST